MSDSACQLMENIEELSKRCYYLQKSNNDLYDYLKEDHQLQQVIDENEQIIEKYHRKIEEIFQMMKEHSEDGKAIHWSPIAANYRKMEDEERTSCLKKKNLLTKKEMNPSSTVTDSDQGVFL